MNSRSRNSNDLSLPLEFTQQFSTDNNHLQLSSLPPAQIVHLPVQNHWVPSPAIQTSSSSRDELYPPSINRHQHPLLPRLDQHHSPQIKREQRDPLPYSNQQPTQNSVLAMEDSMPSTSDFVKKLYKMLEDQSFQDVVSWGPHGDCFVVKDMNEFTKSILPRMFKHSNFASFVRQLNKYDFHKVKNTDDNSFGEHSWTFRHPDFHADRRDALENIKRKVPASRKSLNAQNAASTTRPMGPSGSTGMPIASGSGSTGGSPGPGPFYASGGNGYGEYHNQQLQSQVDRLNSSHDELSSHIRSLERNIGNLERNLSGLERNYHEVLVEMVGFQRNMAQQDSVMQGLIEWVLRGGGGAVGEGKGKRRALSTSNNSALLTNAASGSSSNPFASSSSQPMMSSPSQQLASGPSGMAQSPSLSNENPFVSSSVAQQILGPSYRSYVETNSNSRAPNNSMAVAGFNDSVGRAALMKMSEISRKAGAVLNESASNPSSSGGNTAATSSNMFGFGDGVGDTPPSRLWTAASNAGLINPDGSFVDPLNTLSASSATPDMFGGGVGGVGPTKITSRRDALVKIEELQRMRPASAGFLSNAAAKLVNAMETFGPTGVKTMGSSQQDRENSIASSMSDTSDEVVMPSVSTITGGVGQKQPEQEQNSQSNDVGVANEPWNMTLPSVPPLSSFNSSEDSSSQQQRQEQSSPPLSMLNPFPEYASDHEGLQVYTVGHLMPKSAIDDMSGTWSFDAGMFGGGNSGSEFTDIQLNTNTMLGGQEIRADGGSSAMGSSSSSQSLHPLLPPTSSSSNSGTQKLRVRRSTFVPGWAVSPRVLLVDDDAVSRKLSSKFLQVFGCKIDVAVDGVGAVNKMNLEKYDLVLMDIVMPKLDGVSATSMIRQFDHMTPIISMTSNSKPNEIMTYYHSGMNDILPKPFTKQGLLDMLEKHLMHLKVIQQMSRVPRSVGIPPLSDSAFEEAITSQAALMTRQNNINSGNELASSSSNSGLALSSDLHSSSTFSFSPPTSDDDSDMGRLNPLAGMGLTDEQYNMILNGIVNGETFAGSIGGQESAFSGATKRRLEGQDDDDMREGKRSRFEVIE